MQVNRDLFQQLWPRARVNGLCDNEFLAFISLYFVLIFYEAIRLSWLVLVGLPTEVLYGCMELE